MPPEHEIIRMAQRTLERLRRMGEIPPEDGPPSDCNRGRETPAIGGGDRAPSGAGKGGDRMTCRDCAPICPECDAPLVRIDGRVRCACPEPEEET